ncbi:MAG TPA: hypothetical protein VN893_22300 [Bryobacteraceae bacterium]|nr:hypothetical protein [Bryobacteraceae bacterium]
MIAIWIALAGALGQAAAPAPRDEAIEREQLTQLLTIRRVYVERLNGGETAAQMRDMIIGSLERSRLFVITENQDRADAILRGSAEDLIFTETFSSSDGVNARASESVGSSGYGVGNATDSKGRLATRSLGTVHQSVSGALGGGENDSLHTQERKHEATASVRLVTKDGDVIWSTTQESLGGRFRGASADVAERVTRQLLADYERAKNRAGNSPVSAK